jgi:co-chaperonin GroES (HSP10)
MKPLNRRLLIEVVTEQPEEGAFFVPTEEKVEQFMVASVLACADNCSQDLTGKTVVIHAFGTEEVIVKGKKYTFVGENHLICVE